MSELVAVLTRFGVLEDEVNEIITDIVPEVIPLSENIAIGAGKLIATIKNYGLSLGDRACIATGEYCKMEIYTMDKTWLKLQSQITVKINVIR